MLDDGIAGLVLGASIGGLAASWTNPMLGMILGADFGAALMLIIHVLSWPNSNAAAQWVPIKLRE